jgi:hypothetical protein
MDNPKVGDIVLHNSNGYRAEVIGLGSIATARGLATTYNIKFLEGPMPGGPSVNVLREEFTYPCRRTQERC